MVSHRSLPTGLFAIVRFMGKAQASPRVQPRPGNRKDGRHDGSSSSAALSWWEKIKKAWLVIGVLISFVLGAFLFPKKVEEAYEAASQTVQQLPRPVYAIWYSKLGNLDEKALELVHSLHPGSNICVIRREMVDLSRDGWPADLLVEYAESPSESALTCGERSPERDAPRYLAVFTPLGFSFHHAGTAGGSLPSEWVAKDGFLFRYWLETDFPQINVWYVYKGVLIDPEDNPDAIIEMTDLDSDSRYVFQLHTQLFNDGLIGWGTPEGLFHIVITSDGKLLRGSGLPKDLARPNSHARELRWDGHSFVSGKANGLTVGVSANASNEPAIKISPLSHLYVAGCEIVQGFATSPDFPGAVIPVFAESPILECPGPREDDTPTRIRVEREES